MSGEGQLDALRAEIDAIDAELQRLIDRRARCAAEVAQVKRASGVDTAAFYRAEREAQVLAQVRERNRDGLLPDDEMVRLFREIMSACLALEQPLCIAYLGPAGTFTEAAALKHFGHSVGTVPVAAIDEVFREVEAGNADYGVVPVENSTEGVVSHTLDMFLDSPLKVCGEVEMRIHHCLLHQGGTLADVKRVCAHQQALAQCRRWLDQYLPGAERVALGSNAEAARRAAGEPGSAAIASANAAELYGLDILAGNIEDEPDNTTRFLVVGRNDVAASGQDKTVVLFSTRNQPGALYKVLQPLAENGISMTRIESRPSRRGAWDYVFFIDLEGHRSEPKLAAALQALEESAQMLRVLGSFPRSLLQG